MSKVLAVAVVAVVGGLGQERAATDVSLLLTFGLNARGMERWDGGASVSGGQLVHVSGWHFSAGDSAGIDGWKCALRRDEVAPYADIHYTEMRPGEKPAVLFQPVGVFLTLRDSGSARVTVRTGQGNFAFALSDIGMGARTFLDGRVSVARVPSAIKLSDARYEDDEPAIAALPDGVAVAWVAYRDRADRELLRTFANGAWSAVEEVTPKPGEVFRCALAASRGELWVFWSERAGDAWRIVARRKSGGAWSGAEPVAESGSNTFLRAAAAPDGTVFVAWQSFRGGQSDIYARVRSGGAWLPEVRVSESPANDWEPAVAAGPDGSAYVAWDSYDKGNYDICFRAYRGGRWQAAESLTSSAKFQAHAAVAVDGEGRPWVAWDESGVNWGKDQGFLIPIPLAAPLHQERAVRLARWDGQWREPREKPPTEHNAEHPQLVFDGAGGLALVFRRWTRRNSRTIGSPMMWEDYVTRFDGARWTAPAPFPESAGSIEKHAALARDASGEPWAAWMTDGRPFATMKPANADVYCARLGMGTRASFAAESFEALRDPAVEAIPVHGQEAADVRRMRSYVISSGGRQYRIWRGDMHRHTDVSQDFKYDGSLIELYRYALDAAAFDYIAPTDHQAGYDQEFTWWQNQKLVDLFFQPGRFAPLYAYERSVPYPNGHRNVIFDHPGVRTLPIPPEEMNGTAGAAKLYEYLRQNHGVSMPHSSATNQGTDWRDNDASLEPLVEIYQGYRTSYEYEGAPRAASALNPHAQKSGWQPAGFWWNALAKGYKLGVQSSSDHWSTHISYACLVAEQLTREGLVNAIRRRHAYGATDNIVLDFRAEAGGREYLMGDAFASEAAPRLRVHAIGTGAIRQIDVIKNRTFVYVTRPGTREANFEYTDKDFAQGQSWYYVRVLQEDGQLAWSSPVWVEH